MDLISNLPKHILYEILSRMPEKDAARTSILSKSWSETWSTSPILILKVPMNAIIKKGHAADEKDPQQIQVMKERNYFLNHVDSTLQRFHDQGLAIKHFKLYLDYSNPLALSPLIDYWMELVCLNELEVLQFSLFRLTLFHGQLYCLPHKFLESKSLVKLSLYGCIEVDKAFLNHPIKFTSLKVLSLSFVTVEEQIIKNLFSCCPLIEYVTLKNCPGLKFVSINNLPKLKGAEFIRIQEVFVDAPNLECFQFHYFVGVDRTSCKINFDNCRNLRDLCLTFKEHVIITSPWLIELLHKFPLLERLKLNDCTISNKIQISTMQLKVLKFTNCSMLEEACIDAPKLDSFSYHCCELTMPTSVSFSNNSDSLEFDVRIDIGLELDFLKLREFLQNIEPLSVLASLVLKFDYLTDEFNPYVLQGLLNTPPCIKQLQIHYFSNLETVCLPLPIGLLWTCRPAILSIMMNSTLCSRILVKLFCEMLRGEDDNSCCNCGDTKCWWHGLKDVQVTRSCGKDENVVIDCKTLLDSLPTLSTKEEIRFRLRS